MPAGWLTPLRSNIARFVLAAFLFQMAAMGGVLLFVQQATERALIGEEKALADELRDELLDAFHADGRAELVELINVRVQPAHGNVPVILLARRDGTPIAGNLGAWPPVIPDRTRWRTIDLYRLGSDRPERVGVVTTVLPDGTRLLTGHAINASVRLARVNNRAMIIALLVGLSLALASALILGRMLSRHIERIVSTTRAVGEGALARRVPVNGSGDAFDALGGAINAMLERIDALVLELRITTDGLAHDLKSPVTRLKSAIEQAMARTDDATALSALEKVAVEAETLLSMLSRALLISGTEAGVGREGLTTVDVGALLADIAEIYGPLAEDDGFTITTDTPAGLHAVLHRELMSQAIGNLVENALKYATGGHRIALRAEQGGGGLVLVVADDGPGIAIAQRAEALRRFGRLDPARRKSGSGLGLPLVAAVARLHGGSVALEDNMPGLRVVIRLGQAA
ncbi:sensor histidine kinase [Hephaestia sp. GCM10023244]|uniref:sensor histidine kinase n=1 Tax=unclassified Hephaestia TaxID=2631281 RepID=UPI0020773FD7|nr:HAMP domain-containing sensor histidine kinase [Hephaestia sp. MAHUQ-44]MCM8729888.1 HAMP domain-containing histidine kinase [Hephaestia sp. MAHUQ-44]